MYPNSGDTLNTITSVRLPNGQTVGIVDWSWKPLYSTVDMKSGLTDLEMYAFTYGQGDNVSMSSNFTSAQVRTATLNDTNISATSEMSSTEEMLVYAIAIETYQFTLSGDNVDITLTGQPVPNAPNMGVLHSRLIVELEVSEKAYYQASYGWFAAGFGPNIGAAYAPAAVAAARSFATNGLPSRDAIDRSPVPVHIGGTEKYKLIFHNPQASAIQFYDDEASAESTYVVRSRANLVGLYKRPVA